MLRFLVRFSLRFRGVVIALACAFLGYGLYATGGAKYSVFPEFAPPQVVIQTEAPGLSPQQVEVLVTQPIENTINGAPGIASLRSGSIQGLSVITVVFNPASDIHLDRQVVAERLASLTGELPGGVRPPVMTPLISSTGTVLAVGLTSRTQPLMKLRSAADWTVKPQLMAVSGVAHVSVFGGDVREIQVQFEPQRLVQYGLSADDIIAAARQSTGIRGAGFIETPNQRIVLQNEGQSLTAEQIAQTVVVHSSGASLTLGEVTRVMEGAEPRISAASVNGVPGVILMVDSQFGANTLEVTQRIDQALGELQPTFAAEGITVHAGIFRPANFIQAAIHNMGTSLLLGAALIVVVLFLFLFSFRTAAISCTAIPLSLLAAVVVLQSLGQTLNTMTLGGLAIAIGEVVDDAVIDVENIYRRLRENRAAQNPRPAIRVVFDASLEVRSAVVYATFAVVLVFFPVLTLSGLAGRIFEPLGTAYIWAIVASLLVALTLTPALCLVLLGGRQLPPAEPPIVRWLKAWYRRLLLAIERSPRLVLATVALIMMAGLAVVPRLRGSFLPELREGHFILHVWAIPGTSIDESLRMGGRISQALLELSAVRAVAQRVGRAEAYEDTWGTHYSEMEVDLKPLEGEAAARARSEVQAKLREFAGVNSSVETFLTERIEETLSGFAAGVAVNVFGNDLDVLDQEAQEVANRLGKVRGATAVQLQSPPGMPQVVVRLRKQDLARWGFDPLTVLDAVRTAYGGNTVGQVYDGNRVVDVTVILQSDARTGVQLIGALPLRGTRRQLRRTAGTC